MRSALQIDQKFLSDKDSSKQIKLFPIPEKMFMFSLPIFSKKPKSDLLQTKPHATLGQEYLQNYQDEANTSKTPVNL